MKCEIIIDPQGEEKIIIYAKKETEKIREIKELAECDSSELIGYIETEIFKLNPKDIHHISVENGRVYAVCGQKKYLLKERIYTLEEILPPNFAKINQSCLANIKQIERFDTSISGTLKIRFKNGDVDYVSRRQLKTIKEKVGI